MNKIGSAIFCFAVLCVGALFISPRYGLKLYMIGWVVMGTAWLAWMIYSILHRRWSALLFIPIAALLAWLLFQPVFGR